MKIKILSIPVDRRPYVANIEDSLENLQRYVGGYIEVIQLTGSSVLVVNEEGRINSMKRNGVASKIFRQLCDGDAIFGDAFICGVEGEEFTDITEFIDKIIAPNAKRLYDREVAK